MGLIRSLRAEGITPATIEQNRGLLISAIKKSLAQRDSTAGSSPASYKTAPESSSYNALNSSVCEMFGRYQPKRLLAKGVLICQHLSLSLGCPRCIQKQYASANSTVFLSSGPPKSASFSEAFLEEHRKPIRSLDLTESVKDGMTSLMVGMKTAEGNEGDDEEYVDDEDSDAIGLPYRLYSRQFIRARYELSSQDPAKALHHDEHI